MKPSSKKSSSSATTGTGTKKEKAKDEKAIWILGHMYRPEKKNGIQERVKSLMRLTYRSGFPALEPYSWLTSDAGWGCMLRSAQMILATAFIRHHLGENWRFPKDSTELSRNSQYTNILRLFMDYSGESSCLYSLPNLVQCGIKFDKLPGEWFGPNTAALVLRDLSRLHRRLYGGGIEVVVTQGDTIYINDVEAAATTVAFNNNNNNNGNGNYSNKEEDEINNNSNYNVFSKASDGGVDPTTAATTTRATTTTTTGRTMSTFSVSPLEQAVEEKVDELLRSRMTFSNNNNNNNNNGGNNNNNVRQSFFDPLFNRPPEVQRPWQCGIVVLVPLLLGQGTVSSAYVKELQEQLRNPFSIGFIGGRPNHALYFAGYSTSTTTASNGATTTTNAFLGLDPHTTYATPPLHEIKPNNNNNNNNPSSNPNPTSQTTTKTSSAIATATAVFPSTTMVSQVHVDRLESVAAANLDPSLALGFYFRDKSEFALFCEQQQQASRLKAEQQQQQGGGGGVTSIVHVQQAAPSEQMDFNRFSFNGDDDDDDEDNNNNNNNNNNNKNGEGKKVVGKKKEDDDEYVFI